MLTSFRCFVIGAGLLSVISCRTPSSNQGIGTVPSKKDPTIQQPVAPPSKEKVRSFSDPYMRQVKAAKSDAEKIRIATIAAEDALKAQLHEESLRWYLWVYENEKNPTKKAEVKKKLLGVIDGQLNWNDIQRLAEKSSNPFLQEHLWFKEAAVAYHLGDWDGLFDAAERYNSKFANGEYAQRLSEMLTRAQSRNQVDPTTVAVLLPLSGRGASQGRRAEQALRMAQKAGGSKIRWIVKDTKGDPYEAAKALEESVLRDGASSDFRTSV